MNKFTGWIAVCFATIVSTQLFSITEFFQSPKTPAEALTFLKNGNRRFTENRMTCLKNATQIREHFAHVHHPSIIILGCSDSRVNPELIFDLPIGHLYVVETAGNVLGKIGLDTILFGYTTYQCPLIVVLGHQDCRTIEAALKDNLKNYPYLLSLLEHSIAQTKEQKNFNLLGLTKANINFVVNILKTQDAFIESMRQGKLKVVGAYYHLNTGKVDFF